MANQNLYYPSNLQDSDLFPCHIHFTFFNRRSTWESGMADQVHLYMPEKFGQPSTLSWESESLTKMLGGMANQAMGDIAGRFMSQAAQGRLQKALGQYGTPAADLVFLETGYIVNPYITQMFRGVNLRNFDFIFKFMPQTEKDCDTIQDIIRIFRKYSLPSGSGQFSFTTSPFLSYPGEVEIRYVFQGEENPYIHKFKRSIISAIDIDYTGEGSWATMRNGFPATTVMTLKMAELQIIVREDVDLNY